jgi:FkbM family methyltransferase
MAASDTAIPRGPLPGWRAKLAQVVGWRLRTRGSERLLRLIYPPAAARSLPADTEAAAWDGTLVHLDTSSYIEWMTYVRGGYERELQALMHRMVRPGDTVIDVGANVGVHTCSLARRVGPAGLVVAIEPLVELADRLEANLALNGLDNVKLIRVAASTQQGTAEIFPPQAGAANQGQGTLHPRPGLDRASRVVATDTIDNIAAELGLSGVRLIKVDVEGHELSALRGAEATLRAFRPRVLFEYDATNYAAAGVTWGDIAGYLAGLNYRLGQVHGSHVKALYDTPGRFCMVLAAPR